MILDIVTSRLESMSYQIKPNTDNYLLEFSIDKNKNYIMNQTNLVKIPEELMEIWADMSIADFLQTKWATNTLDIDSIDFTPIVSSIQEGDTKIDMATGKDSSISEEGRFLTMLDLMRDNQVSFARFRRFKW